MAGDVEVRTELTLDSSADEVVQRIRNDFESLDDQVDETQSSLKDFGTQFLATFAAVNLVPAIEQFAELATGIVDVGSAAFDTEQGIAGLVAGMTGNEWGVARAFAEDLNDQFVDLNVNVGQAKDDIIAGHKALTTFLGGTSRAMQVASDNMANITTIANVQGHAVQELAGQFGKMAAGFVATESAAFNLLRTTGIFADDITKVLPEWQKLTQEERVRRLEGAFTSIADNLKEAPATLSDMVTSIQGIGNEFLETFGKAAMSEFMGGLGDLRGDLQDTRAGIKEAAADMGRELGTFVNDALSFIRENADDIKDTARQISESVVSGFKFAKEAVSWILEHKTQLMVLGGLGIASQTGLGRAAGGFVAGAAGRMAAGQAARSVALGGAAGIGGQALAGQAAATSMGRVSTAMGNLTRSMGPAATAGGRLGQSFVGLFSAIAAGGPPVWAATAALTALGGGLVYLVNKANEAEQERQKTIETGLEEFTRLSGKWGELTQAEIRRMDQLKLAAEEAAADSPENQLVAEKFDAIWQERLDGIVGTYVRPLMTAQRQIENLVATSSQANEEMLVQIAMQEAQVVSGVTGMFNTAWKGHNDAAMQYIVRVLHGSEDLRKAFFASADMTAEGFGKLSQVATEMGEEFRTIANMSRERQGLEIDMSARQTAPQVNFNGGQVFKIQQEFREQDPDRIAVAFERRITQAAVSRVQASTTTPFGT